MSSDIIRMESRLIFPGARKKKVAVYSRVSSDKEAALDSLNNQSLAYVNQINANPEWDLVNIYGDRGISGTIELRPAFQQMLADCRAGKIDLIITKSFSRFARNTVVLLTVLRELKALGVEVVFENDHIRSFSAGGELLTTLLAAKAQAESFSASENQRWRIRKLFERGLLASNVRMLGYRTKNKGLIVVPDEARIVQQIYEDYLSGMGYVTIAKKLNQLSIPSFTHRQWGRSTIHDILKNEKYTGTLLLQKTYTEDHISKQRLVNRGERRMYRVKNNHEAIIPESQARLVLDESKRRADKFCQRKARDQRISFFSLLICAKCGKQYRFKTAASGTKYAKPIWVCSTYNLYGKEKCPNKQIAEKILIVKTMEALEEKELSLSNMEKIKEIRIMENRHLIFLFKDGAKKDIQWQYPSRRESWTPEMRQKAREKTLARYRKATI